MKVQVENNCDLEVIECMTVTAEDLLTVEQTALINDFSKAYAKGDLAEAEGYLSRLRDNQFYQIIDFLDEIMEREMKKLVRKQLASYRIKNTKIRNK